MRFPPPPRPPRGLPWRGLALSLLWLPAVAMAAAGARGGPGQAPAASTGGHDPCPDFVARLPNVKAPLCAAAQLKPTVGRSFQGRTLYARDVVAPEARIRVLVIGACTATNSRPPRWRCTGSSARWRRRPTPT